MFIPRSLETLERHRPWANWALMAVNVIVYFLTRNDEFSENAGHYLVLTRDFDFGLVGYMFTHAGFLHLAGNMLFLWVFGNALCATVGNFRYLALYLIFGLLAAGGHLLISDAPAVGASGAICGVVGCILALFPINRVHLTAFFMLRLHDFSLRAWILVSIWILFDAWGAMSRSAGVAYGAHLGGYAAGILIGFAGLCTGWITLTVFDNKSLPELLLGKEFAREDG